ncbi:MAG: N-acetylmuramoyl-L-alanine amidase [Alphaproteobacteria bacterium]|nr:N-acetylmuramoyl-L-alanine amidase [Alphaproteobacteria bacterium]
MLGRKAFISFLAGVLLKCHIAAAAQPAVTAVRIGEHVGLTRLVLDVTEKVDFHTFTLANPYRVVVDLTSLDWQVAPSEDDRRGVIVRLRFGQFRRDTSRMVIEVLGPVEVKQAFLLPPQGNWAYRFVIDLAPVDEASFVNSVGAPKRLAKPSPSEPSRKSAVKRIVVLDPGHGGVDPGAIGVSGVFEKTVTLSAARELRKILQKTNRYKVILTRSSDKFMRLRDRVAVARDIGAELFVSLHADAIRRQGVRGASVYTLSEKASDAEAAALAAKENKADLLGGVQLEGESEEVTSILIDLVQRETKNLSAGFANIVLPEFSKRVRTLRNGHRFAGFAVLKAPDVPSVLVEMGYLSNRQDERMLSTAEGRRPVLEALGKAIDRYFAENDG